MGAIGGEEVGGRIAAALGDEASVDSWVDDPAPSGERVAAAREANLEAEQRVLSRPSAAAEVEGAGAALRQEDASGVEHLLRGGEAGEGIGSGTQMVLSDAVGQREQPGGRHLVSLEADDQQQPLAQPLAEAAEVGRGEEV